MAGEDGSGGRSSGVFVPCPSCGHALELPTERILPDRLECPGCTAVLQRGTLMHVQREFERRLRGVG